MNIEQLAIEHGEKTFSAISLNENGDAVVGVAYIFTKDELEAFAKAYAQQQSEPVAWCIDDGFTKKILNKTPSDEDIATAKRFNWLAYPLYTQPPNTVSLEKYNKVLDALKVIRDSTYRSAVTLRAMLANAIEESERSVK